MATPGQRPGGDAVRESSDGVGEDQPEVQAQRRRRWRRRGPATVALGLAGATRKGAARLVNALEKE